MVARLVDQDLLQYDAQVTDYWPEFGQNGKGGDNITIADVLRHECGLTTFGHTFDSQDFLMWLMSIFATYFLHAGVFLP